MSNVGAVNINEKKSESNKSQSSRKKPIEMIVFLDEIECDIDEDLDDEHYTEKMINDSFINKPKDISTFNPSGIKGKEKISTSMMLPAFSHID